VKFSEAVKMKASGCAKCFAATYTLPCRLDPSIAKYLVSFGKPRYRLDAVKLLRIDTTDGFHIEGKIGLKTIKFTMPKNFAKLHINKIARKKEFEKSLAAWLTDTLKIQITI